MAATVRRSVNTGEIEGRAWKLISPTSPEVMLPPLDTLMPNVVPKGDCYAYRFDFKVSCIFLRYGMLTTHCGRYLVRLKGQ